MVREELQRFGPERVGAVERVVREHGFDGADAALILALGSRESGLRNIVGDHGYGRGFLQIDDRFHGDFLAAVEGCPSGSWEVEFDSARPKGRVPTLEAATKRAIAILGENLSYARAKGVPQGQRLRFALAAYNAGPRNAERGWRAGNVDLHTTGGDYSRDVLRRCEEIRPLLEDLRGGEGRTQPRDLGLRSPSMSGGDVRAHQRRLNLRLRARGLTPIDEDGIYGPDTERATRRVKRLLGWPRERLRGATVEDQRWIAKPSLRPADFKARAARRRRHAEAKRRASGRASMPPAAAGHPRHLALVSPRMVGDDVARLQRRLGIAADRVYGPITDHAVAVSKRNLGFPPGRRTTGASLFYLRMLYGEIEPPEEYRRRAERVRRIDARRRTDAATGDDARQKALRYALAHADVREQPHGSNRGPDIDAWQRECGHPPFRPDEQGWPWCGCFVHGCYLHGAGIDLHDFVRDTAWIYRTAKANAHSLRMIPLTEAKAGDLVLVGHVGEHVGMVREDYRGGPLRTVEGNIGHRVTTRDLPVGRVLGIVRVGG